MRPRSIELPAPGTLPGPGSGHDGLSGTIIAVTLRQAKTPAGVTAPAGEPEMSDNTHAPRGQAARPHGYRFQQEE